MLVAPHVAAMSCQECVTWMHEDWKPVLRFGNKVKRPAGTSPPCWKCPKIPTGSPTTPYHAVEVDAGTIATWRHYRECKAVGSFPDDAATRYMAGLIARVEELVAEEKDDVRFLQLGRVLMTAAMTKGMKGG